MWIIRFSLPKFPIESKVYFKISLQNFLVPYFPPSIVPSIVLNNKAFQNSWVYFVLFFTLTPSVYFALLFHQDFSCWVQWSISYHSFSEDFDIGDHFFHLGNHGRKRGCILFLHTSLFFLLPYSSLLFCLCGCLPISQTLMHCCAPGFNPQYIYLHHQNSLPWWSNYLNTGYMWMPSMFMCLTWTSLIYHFFLGILFNRISQFNIFKIGPLMCLSKPA